MILCADIELQRRAAIRRARRVLFGAILVCTAFAFVAAIVGGLIPFHYEATP